VVPPVSNWNRLPKYISSLAAHSETNKLSNPEQNQAFLRPGVRGMMDGRVNKSAVESLWHRQSKSSMYILKPECNRKSVDIIIDVPDQIMSLI
jgi:hypothetical protein